MEFWISMIVSIVCAMLASTGLWTLIQKRMDKKDAKSKMILGLGHDRIVELGNEYIRKGYITVDEYENLHDYLWKPYAAMGGNGSAKRIMDEVNRLPIRDNPAITQRSQKNDDA